MLIGISRLAYDPNTIGIRLDYVVYVQNFRVAPVRGFAGYFRFVYPARGTPYWLAQWCAIRASTSRETLSWCGTLLAL